MAILKRLSKVARELNVGISTIVEFLSSQNKEVSSNPNTKIGEELYMLLLQEFQKENNPDKEQIKIFEKIVTRTLYGIINASRNSA